MTKQMTNWIESAFAIMTAFLVGIGAFFARQFVKTTNQINYMDNRIRQNAEFIHEMSDEVRKQQSRCSDRMANYARVDAVVDSLSGQIGDLKTDLREIKHDVKIILTNGKKEKQ